ncbi:MAG: hypothetical protein LBC40_05385 [Dysgonamonadaceae bacterium]|nr:hypothetical protein [Dysgonamonadaceae bacterium]
MKHSLHSLLIAVCLTWGASSLQADDFRALSLKSGHDGIWCDKLTFDGHEMTLETWLYIDPATASNGITIAASQNDLKGWRLVLDWDIWIKFSFRTPSQGWADLLIPRDQFVGKWGHLAVSVSATENSVVYVNGSPLTGGDSNKKIDGGFYGNDKDNQAFQIAYWYDNPKPICKFADFRIWKTTRTAAQISDNYNRHLEGENSDLYLNYKLAGNRRDLKTYAADPTGEKNTAYLNPEANWENYYEYETLAQMPQNLTIAQNEDPASCTATWQGTANQWEVAFTNTTQNTIVSTETTADNSKTFTGLALASTYEVRVRAKNFVYSGWTSPQSITIGTTAIKNPAGTNPAGGIYFDKSTNILNVAGFAAGENIRIFDQQGRLCLSSTDNRINLSHIANGLYIVRAGAQIRKIIK